MTGQRDADAGSAVKTAVAAAYRQVAPGWHRWRREFAVAGTAITTAVLDAAQPRPGAVVLDVGCGAGEPSLQLAERVRTSGLVAAVDLVAEMLPARRGAADPCFCVADGEALPFAAESFDLVTSRLALMHFPDPVRAAREMHRVLRPGGRCVVAVLGPAQVTSALVQVLIAQGARVPRLPDLPDPHRLGAPGTIASVLTAAGFEEVRDRVLECSSEWPGTAEDFWRAVPDHGFLVGDLIRSLTPDARRRAESAVLSILRRHEIDGAVRLPVLAVLATGVHARSPG